MTKAFTVLAVTAAIFAAQAGVALGGIMFGDVK